MVESGKGCVLQPVVVTPGTAVGELRIGVSAPEDVLRVLGEDSRLDR